ncbi:MAG TPA: hypothetical protein VIT91_00670, partial [Chthoniobacterales bacterium]
MTGWRVHAWVLMSNHYHLFIETPEPNLVTGMKWLQNAWTRRFNVRHRAWGRVFGHRCKAAPSSLGQIPVSVLPIFAMALPTPVGALPILAIGFPTSVAALPILVETEESRGNRESLFRTMRVFLSHISEEAAEARAFKKGLEKALPGSDVFV